MFQTKDIVHTEMK